VVGVLGYGRVAMPCLPPVHCGEGRGQLAATASAGMPPNRIEGSSILWASLPQSQPRSRSGSQPWARERERRKRPHPDTQDPGTGAQATLHRPKRYGGDGKFGDQRGPTHRVFIYKKILIFIIHN